MLCIGVRYKQYMYNVTAQTHFIPLVMYYVSISTRAKVAQGLCGLRTSTWTPLIDVQLVLCIYPALPKHCLSFILASNPKFMDMLFLFVCIDTNFYNFMELLISNKTECIRLPVRTQSHNCFLQKIGNRDYMNIKYNKITKNQALLVVLRTVLHDSAIMIAWTIVYVLKLLVGTGC